MTNRFEWGVATSAYQIEGASTADGRTDGIWDHFCRVPGAISDGTNADHAADHYHRLDEDLDLIAALGVDAYRFSVSWPRILPDNSRTINDRGIDFYLRVCDGLISRGIKPVVTLYHWDLPLYLDQRGGWANRSVVDEFEHFSTICFDALGSRVHRWCTINEPWCQAILGYATGDHAPGHTDRAEAWQAAHHLLLAHGRAVRAHAVSAARESEIGIVLNLHTPRPATRAAADREAVEIFMDERNRLFTGPLTGRGYPERLYETFPHVARPEIQPGDMETIARIGTYLGLNYYDEQSVQHDARSGGPGWRTTASWTPQTDMGWPIVPGGLERHVAWVRDTVGNIPLVIAENGIAVADDAHSVADDWRRIRFIEEHLQALERAIEAGANVTGYYYWSLMDNFEWALGLSKRFGLIHVDYTTFKRTPRRSYYYYRDRIANGPLIGRDAGRIVE